MSTITIEAATPTQLAEFAQTYLGLEVSRTEGKPKIQAKMAAAGYSKDTIEVEDPAAPRTGYAGQVSATGEVISEDPEAFKMIIIHAGENKPAKEWVAVNGTGIWIDRGVPQRVKNKYIWAMQNAVQFSYNPSLTGLGDPLLTPTVPFQILGDA